MTAPHIIDCWPAWRGVVPGIPGFDAFLAPARDYALLSADADTVCGASGVNKTRSVRPGAMGIATGPWTPGSAPLTWRSPSCAQEPTFQSGCSSAVNAPKAP